jgi:hypothetical protein
LEDQFKQRKNGLVLWWLPVKIQMSRSDELTCLKAAITFIENGDETLDTARRYNTSLTFYERVAELAETIASEWVVARYFELEYDPYLPKMKKMADVGNAIEVKWTSHIEGSLIIHEYDRPQDIGVLVVGKSPYYFIKGWIPVAMAQKSRYRHSNQPNWWVSQINLQPIENLRRSNYGTTAI